MNDIVYRGRKIPIVSPLPEQVVYFRGVSGACRWVYNLYVEIKLKSIRNYKSIEGAPRPFSWYDFQKFLTVVKNCRCDPDNDYTWLNNYSRQSLNAASSNAEDAFKRWAKGIGRKPKFKSRLSGDIRFPAPRISRTRNGISSEKIGNLKLRQTLPKCPEGTHYANPVISYDKDKEQWFLSVAVAERVKLKRTEGEVVGIDLGLKDTAITSYGKVYGNINKSKKIRKLERKRKRLQRKASKLRNKNINHYCKGPKGGRVPVFKKHLSECKNYQKTLKKSRSVQRKLNGIRDNTIHQMTHEIVTRSETLVIVVEDLSVSNLMKNHHLAKSISDQRLYEIRRQLAYKSEEEGMELIAADRFYPSSKICSHCGHKKSDLKLSDRTYICDNCGTIIDRDLNAAINLANYGLQKLPSYLREVTSADESYKAQVVRTMTKEDSDEAEREVRENSQVHNQSMSIESVR